jgi:hypothetical protein
VAILRLFLIAKWETYVHNPRTSCMCDLAQKPPFGSIHLWLLLAAFSLAFTTGRALAAEEGRPAPKQGSVSVNSTTPGFLDRIATLDGKTYEKATLERVDPDGLLVAFAPVEGGSGSAKLKFRNLPAELRERYGYDPARALDYETARARGEAMWNAENAIWTEQRQAAQAERALWEKELRAQLRLAAEAEQARVEDARKVEEPAYYYPAGWWPVTCNPGQRHARPASHHNHMPQRISPVAATRGPVSPTFGPMRPSGK